MNWAATITARRHWLKWLAPVFSLLVLALVLWLLHRALAGYRLRDVFRQIRHLPASAVLTAGACAVASYLVLSAYDLLALRYVGQKVRVLRGMLTSFIAFAVGHNLGLTTLTGAAIRIRMYGSVQIPATHVAMMSGFCALTNAIGATALIAFSLLTQSTEASVLVHVPPVWVRVAGAVLTIALVSYLVFVSVRRKPIVVRNWSLSLPSLPVTLVQILLAVSDLCFAAGTLYLLMPAPMPVSYPTFLAVYVLSIVAVLIANVPGGLGVLESVIVLAFSQLPIDRVLASLLAFRAIYFLLPLTLATALLAGHEAWLHWHRVRTVAGVARNWLSSVAPQVLGTTVFVAGCVLLLSGATPALNARLRRIDEFMPLPVMEVSHLLGSVIGLGLVVLSRALFRRVHLAWQLALVLLFSGALFSVLKAWNYEEAWMMLGVGALLYLSKDAFYRRAALLEERYSPQWLLGLVAIVGVVIWIGLLAHRRVEYSSELWWTFALYGDAPRSLRAAFVVSLLVATLIAHNWLTPHAPEPRAGDKLALDRIKPTIAASPRAAANLALLDDKRLLVHPQNDAFLMYQVSGRSWIAMGDPVQQQNAELTHAADLAWEFRQLSDEHGGWTVFYEVTPEYLPIYVDLGLALLKLGEEARVKLQDFNLEGSRRAELRNVRRRAERESCSFEVLSPPFAAELMSELSAVSEDWLASKAAHEKRFSVGFFSDAYLQNFPLAVVRSQKKIAAFANLWTTAVRAELSADLMRYSRAAPNSIMDFLLVESMLWGKAQGYEWFNLGMAPLSGLEQRPLAPVWHRMGNFVSEMGQPFYNFEGLRRYKEKFLPEWEPRYLASPGGLALPRVLLDVTTLIAGGLREIVSK